MPIFSNTCYFCEEGNDCQTCPYAKHHGICEVPSDLIELAKEHVIDVLEEYNLSTWAKIRVLHSILDELISAEYFYWNEEYD